MAGTLTVEAVGPTSRIPRVALSVVVAKSFGRPGRMMRSVEPPFKVRPVAPLPEPRFPSLAMLSVAPLPTVTLPAKVFAPDKVRVPPPVSLIPNPPEIFPPMLSEAKFATLIVDACCSARFRLMVCVKAAVLSVMFPFKLIVLPPRVNGPAAVALKKIPSNSVPAA